MTLGNMRANGVRSLDVSCWQCHHRAIMSADPWSDDVPVPTFGPRMVCTRCGIIGADARPNWQEQQRGEVHRHPRRPLAGCARPSCRRSTCASSMARIFGVAIPTRLLAHPGRRDTVICCRTTANIVKHDWA
jgi:hypothetical protein